MMDILIHTQLIRLDQLLKLSGAVMSGGEAKEIIRSGLIKVNDEVCTLRGKKIYPGDRVEYGGTVYVCRSEEV